MLPSASHPQGKGCRLLTPTVVVGGGGAAAAAMLETRTAAVTESKVMCEERGSARTHFRLGQAGGPGVGSWFQLFFVVSFFFCEAAAEGLISRIRETARLGILARSAWREGGWEEGGVGREKVLTRVLRWSGRKAGRQPV